MNGASISGIMTPDPSLPSNQPAHDETYKLPFIYIEKDNFFAQTYNMHRPIRNGKAYSSFQSFSYSHGYNDAMVICIPDKSQTLLASMRGRYSKFQWIVRHDYEVVWQDSEQDNMTALREAILNGRDLKIMISEDANTWCILPVDLANIEQDQNQFVIRSETGFPSSLLLNTGKLNETLKQAQATRITEDTIIGTNYPAAPTYYCCYSDGSYYHYFDEIRPIRRKYKQLKIFARKHSESTKTFLIDKIV